MAHKNNITNFTELRINTNKNDIFNNTVICDKGAVGGSSKIMVITSIICNQ